MKKFAFIVFTSLLTACSISPQKKLSGTFEGILPCADCQKIEAKLTLKPDNTYQYSTVYFKNKERHLFIEKGHYVWDLQKSNVIHLQTAKSSNLPDILLKVSENYLEMCDGKGDVPQGKHSYKLLKTAP